MSDILTLSQESFEESATALMEAILALSEGDPDREVAVADVEAWISEHRPDADGDAIKIVIADFFDWQAE